MERKTIKGRTTSIRHSGSKTFNPINLNENFGYGQVESSTKLMESQLVVAYVNMKIRWRKSASHSMPSSTVQEDISAL